MKKNCKYPKKLDGKGYYLKLMHEYKNYEQLGLPARSLSCFLNCILQNIEEIIENPENDLEKTLGYLATLEISPYEKIKALANCETKPKQSCNILLLVFFKPMIIVELIENNYKLELREELKEQYVRFLEEVTSRCIRDLVEANKVKLHSVPKKVTFADTENLEQQSQPMLLAFENSILLQKREPVKEIKENVEVEQQFESGKSVGHSQQI